MVNGLRRAVALSGLVLFGGCATTPTGPSVMALPGHGKTFEQFRLDDAECRQFALNQIGGPAADQAATDAGVRSAVVGTMLGAAAGAAIGGHQGAGVGAGGGLLIGSAAGAGAAQDSSYTAQRRYDNGYVQCMYAKGEKVPVSGAYMQDRSHSSGAVPERNYPPPPPGSPPPPPPGY